VDQDHPPFGIEQVHVIDDFRAPAVHVQNRLAHQVFVEQNPALLIDERRIRSAAAFIGVDEDGFLLNAHDLFPGDEFRGVAFAVLDVDPDRLGIRLGQPEDQVGEAPVLLVGLVEANPAVEQLGEVQQLVILVAAEDGRRFGCGSILSLALFIGRSSYLPEPNHSGNSTETP
jgi:hypothetical protein